MANRWIRFYSIFLLCFFLVSSFGCIAPPGSKTEASKDYQTKQAIQDYITAIYPIQTESSRIMTEYNSLTKGINPNSNRNEVIGKLEELGRRENEVYIKVLNSNPPIELREFRLEWAKECELRLQMFGLIVRSLKENNSSLVTEAQKLNSEANACNIKRIELLQDISRKYETIK